MKDRNYFFIGSVAACAVLIGGVHNQVKAQWRPFQGALRPFQETIGEQITTLVNEKNIKSINKIKNRISDWILEERNKLNNTQKQFKEAFSDGKMKGTKETPEALEFLTAVQSGLSALESSAITLLNLAKGTYSKEDIARLNAKTLNQTFGK